jgi:hypothetical protein
MHSSTVREAMPASQRIDRSVNRASRVKALGTLP